MCAYLCVYVCLSVYKTFFANSVTIIIIHYHTYACTHVAHTTHTHVHTQHTHTYMATHTHAHIHALTYIHVHILTHKHTSDFMTLKRHNFSYK